jgi:hypothetical protein
MNKRIRELASEAGIELIEPTGHIMAIASNAQSIKIEKFAQLIAEECIDIVENYPSWYGDYRDQIEDAFRGHLVAKMKYHFGVES